MARILTVLGAQKRLQDIPGRIESNGSPTHAQDIHVIVLYPLAARIVIRHQSRANTWDFVGANRSSHAAAAYCDSALYIARRHSPRQWDYVVRVVIVRLQSMRPEIDHFMARCFELLHQILL